VLVVRVWTVWIAFAVSVLAGCAVAADSVDVQIPSTVDGVRQSARIYLPNISNETPVPLLVVLHSWSADYRQKGFIEPCLKECERRGWALIHPDFRGPNRRAQACASNLAVQDVLDAVAYMRTKRPIDLRRIYLVGTSGGGHMTLVLATKAPKLWAGVSAWVPIVDLATWHRQSVQRKAKYATDLVAVCGGPPGSSPEIDRQYTERSPLFHLANAAGLPIDINTGIHDGHSGSVPVSQSLRAFNRLAEVNGLDDRKISDEHILTIVRMRKVPTKLAFVDAPAPDSAEKRDRPVLLRRNAGPARVTIFDGGHEGDMPAAIEWLSRQQRN